MARSPLSTREPGSLFDVLSNARRRRLVALLGEADETDRLSLDALSSRLADREPDGGSAGEVAISLHHLHLPKLDEAGFVRYDPGTQLVEFTDLTEPQVTTRLETVSTDE